MEEYLVSVKCEVSFKGNISFESSRGDVSFEIKISFTALRH